MTTNTTAPALPALPAIGATVRHTADIGSPELVHAVGTVTAIRGEDVVVRLPYRIPGYTQELTTNARYIEPADAPITARDAQLVELAAAAETARERARNARADREHEDTVAGLWNESRDARDAYAAACSTPRVPMVSLAAAETIVGRLAEVEAERDAAIAQLDRVLAVLSRRARAAYDAYAVALESDGEAEELAEARGRWEAERDSRDQLRRELGRD